MASRKVVTNGKQVNYPEKEGTKYTYWDIPLRIKPENTC